MKNNSVTKHRNRRARKLKCSHCNGSGVAKFGETCKICKGKGWLLR